jgi:membrane protein
VAVGAHLRDLAARSERSERAPVLRWAVTVARLAVRSFRICMRYRVTGLAAEAGFFALLSMPPLMLGLVASVGFVGRWLGNGMVGHLRRRTAELAGTFLTPDAVKSVLLPTFDVVLHSGRFEIVSIGFLLSLWSGSRALNVYVDTVSIMYGLGGRRGIVRTRVLSFSMYVAALLVGIVVIPLVLLGPGLLSDFLSHRLPGGVSLSWLRWFYWPVVVGFTVVGFTTLYHIATPIRTPWRRDLPGAVLALTLWVAASSVLRVVIAASVGGASIYGPLATPIVVLIWLYVLAISVLIGAALNAAIDQVFPHPARVAARIRPVRRSRPMTPVRPPSDGTPRETAEIVPGRPVPGRPVPGRPVPGGPVPGRPVPGGPVPGATEPVADPSVRAS